MNESYAMPRRERGSRGNRGGRQGMSIQVCSVYMESWERNEVVLELIKVIDI